MLREWLLSLSGAEALVRSFQKSESGATAVEYTLICGIVFLGIAAAVGSTGDGLLLLMEETVDRASDAMASAGS